MKKNRLLTFLLAMIPGCGLMYLGYMKKGLQNMVMFAATCYMGGFTDAIFGDWIAIFFFLLLPVMWFYQLFDTMHSLTRMKRQEIEIPTDDGFFIPQKLFTVTPASNRAAAKGAAVVLILIGIAGIVYAVLNNLHYVIGWDMAEPIYNAVRGYLVPTIASIALVVVGFRLLKGTKVDKPDNAKDNVRSDLP